MLVCRARRPARATTAVQAAAPPRASPGPRALQNLALASSRPRRAVTAINSPPDGPLHSPHRRDAASEALTPFLLSTYCLPGRCSPWLAAGWRCSCWIPPPHPPNEPSALSGGPCWLLAEPAAPSSDSAISVHFCFFGSFFPSPGVRFICAFRSFRSQRCQHSSDSYTTANRPKWMKFTICMTIFFLGALFCAVAVKQTYSTLEYHHHGRNQP